MPECLYIHIPFCIKKCIYCDFVSVPYDSGLSEKYVIALKKEITLKGGGALIKTLYIGGGTPSVLSEGALKGIFDSLRDNFVFAPDIETTVEANPGTIDEEKIKTLLGLGVNRLSIGVQSFNDGELRMLGRMHSSDDAIKALNAVKASGVNNFSLDLIYGVPAQSLESWKETLSLAVSFNPTHISAYELTPEIYTPLYRFLENGKLRMPEEDLIVEMFDYAVDALEAGGYRHYEISNYARPHFECRHNVNYWRRGQYMGLGAGAHSFSEGRRIKNTGDILKYIESLSEGKLPMEEVMEVSSVEAVKESLFLGLRMAEGIGADGFKKDYGMELTGASEELIREGFMAFEEGRLSLTRKGILVSNSAIVRLYEKLRL